MTEYDAFGIEHSEDQIKVPVHNPIMTEHLEGVNRHSSTQQSKPFAQSLQPTDWPVKPQYWARTNVVITRLLKPHLTYIVRQDKTIIGILEPCVT